ncbi:MAG: hypothetical protein A2934_01810 [Candidatus Sungbacteria bacterium RIFCSPLOWO2_01_FULL_47_10]|uniref:ATPase dynein-related AAA domain-containing protein n=1 Tax=Candidatus Sungbacteria bacterium RIFCSPLOWO2_01_FULL_47_10 TaxID=1802276 RepID=A0A1G2L0N3_9BACT|nr:MAG: hypothetical protein A2934_01810 [Candidatus Sungbacteria bacterium RIFCSPLOWO2_01_FULL_47_10]
MLQPYTIGWERILPELATFFAALAVREKTNCDLAPFNLFLAGRPGANKTAGVLGLCTALGYSVGIIDCSTLDDVAELAGVTDIHANREHGIAQIIEGDLLNKDVLILDEFLNAKPHVVPQFRLMLQRKLILLAKEVPMNIKCLIATANLSDDMDAGDANVLDSPTADRFAMLVHVPSFSDLNTDEQDAIIERSPQGDFGKTLAETVNAACAEFGAIKKQSEKDVTRFVRIMFQHLAGAENSSRNTQNKSIRLSFEGRRAQIFRDFTVASLAASRHLTRYNPEKFETDGITLKMSVACLGVPKLTGGVVPLERIHNAHQEALIFLKKNFLSRTEIEILDAPTLVDKIGIMARYMHEIPLTVKIDIMNSVLASDDIVLKLAVLELLHSPLFADEPAEFKNIREELARALSQSAKARSERGVPEHVPDIPDGMEQARPYALIVSGGDAGVFADLMRKAKKILDQLTISP